MSATLDVKTPDGKTNGTVELPAELFDVQANIPLLHQVVVAQLAAARQGTHATKTRGDVRGGGKKPYRQKGTGRARQGSIRAPQFAGGGIVHGPQPRDYSQRTPKKMKAAALRGALSDRARAGQLHVVTALHTGDSPSTKAARKALESITDAKRVLVVLTRDDELTQLSVRNLSNVHVLSLDQLNTYDVLVNDDVVFTKDAFEALLAKQAESAAGKSKTATAKAAVSKAAPKSASTGETASPALQINVELNTTQAPTAAPETEAAEPFGPGSHAPLANPDEQPEGFPIKGNADSKLYHVPGSSFYQRTVAEVWFASAEAAEAAGFQLPPSQRKAAEAEEDDK